jgi:hypothetical protein
MFSILHISINSYLARAVSLGLRLAANIEINLSKNKFNLYKNPGTLPKNNSSLFRKI